MGIPKLPAFCLTAPGVRFIVLEIAFTEVLLFECAFNWRTSCVVHARRFLGFAIRCLLLTADTSNFRKRNEPTRHLRKALDDPALLGNVLDICVNYEPAEKSKSKIHVDLLPLINNGAVDLLDHERLVMQLTSLERRTSRGGRDSIDHVPGAHDDIDNAVDGALVAAF